MAPQEFLSNDTLYEESYAHLRETDDVSFKLLGIVPLISGTGIVTLFWGEESVPASVVWLLALFAASVALALYRWELKNIGVCWSLMQRIGAIEQRWAQGARASAAMSSTLDVLKPPNRIDKPEAEAVVYGATILVWLIVPWLHSCAPTQTGVTIAYVAVSGLIGLLALYSIVWSLRTHHWPATGNASISVESRFRLRVDQRGNLSYG